MSRVRSAASSPQLTEHCRKMPYGESGSSSGRGRDAYEAGNNPGNHIPLGSQAPFEIFEWHPYMQSCHKYFLDHAQYTGAVQALAAFLNIILPYQKEPTGISSSNTSSPHSGPTHHLRPSPFAGGSSSAGSNAVSLVPYVRRLVATGFDKPEVLHGFFGDDWARGVGPIHEIERRNYLFAAKSSSWLKVKSEYDMNSNETVPFLKPLQRATEEEIAQAESQWSDWLAMQDWMVGPRAPGPDRGEAMSMSPGVPNVRIKRERKD